MCCKLHPVLSWHYLWLGMATTRAQDSYCTYFDVLVFLQVRKDEIDLLYNLLDINRDGLLELKEVVKSQERTAHGKPFDESFRDTIARVA